MEFTLPASSPDFIAARRVRISPIGITSMPFGPQPLLSDRRRVSQSVSEPAVVTPMRLPLRSSIVLIGPFLATTSDMLRGSAAMAATAMAGTPLTT